MRRGGAGRWAGGGALWGRAGCAGTRALAAATGSKFPPSLSRGACLSPPLWCGGANAAAVSPALRCRAIWARSATAVRSEPAVRTRRLLHFGLQCTAGPKPLLAVSGAWCPAWPPCWGRRTAKVSWGAGGWGVRRGVLLRPGLGAGSPAPLSALRLAARPGLAARPRLGRSASCWGGWARTLRARPLSVLRPHPPRSCRGRTSVLPQFLRDCRTPGSESLFVSPTPQHIYTFQSSHSSGVSSFLETDKTGPGSLMPLSPSGAQNLATMPGCGKLGVCAALLLLEQERSLMV